MFGPFYKFSYSAENEKNTGECENGIIFIVALGGPLTMVMPSLLA